MISGNNGVGISFSDQPGNVVVGNRIGTNADGTAAVPNSADGIGFEDVSFQTIGGTAAGEGNLISGNGGNGLYFNSGYEMTSAKFQGNTIGLAVDGVTPLPNGGAGIFLDGVSDGGRIGGTSPGAGNVISGNLGTGVLIGSSDGWRLEGNRIGVTAAGTALAPNGASQVIVDSSDSGTIGGTIAAARNVISGGSSSAGIILDSGTDDSHVEGNYIGTNAGGHSGLGNGTGIQVVGGAHDNTIGGAVGGAGNVISGSARGVRLDNAGDGNRVVGNSIGTNAAETAVIPNGIGVELDGMTDAQIGTTSPGAANVIGGNSDTGILVVRQQHLEHDRRQLRRHEPQRHASTPQQRRHALRQGSSTTTSSGRTTSSPTTPARASRSATATATASPPTRSTTTAARASCSRRQQRPGEPDLTRP